MPKRPLRILLVEDHEDYYHLVDMMLSDHRGGPFSYELEWANTYQAGLQRMLLNQHDVYLIDHHLGRQHGLDLLRAALQAGCKAPMIMVTAEGDHHIDEAALRAGAADYLVKGEFSAPLLKRAIRYAIERTRTLKALRESEEALRNSEARFRGAFENAATGMALLSIEGRWLRVNRSLAEMLGFDQAELLDHNLKLIHHSDDKALDISLLAELLQGPQHTHQTEVRCRHKSGMMVWLLMSVSAVFDGAQHPLYYIAQLQDITQRKRVEAGLLHEALHDKLTGLPNRSLFMQRLGRAIERSSEDQGYLFAVMFLDLDRFKNINDSFGHLVGDLLLIEAAHRLETCTRPTGDLVSRLGGDEFAVLVEDLASAENINAIAERMVEVLSAPFLLEEQEVFLGVSIGISLSTIAYSRPEEMLRDADTALYKAKADGKGRYEVFDTAMHLQVVTRTRMESDLRRAIEREELRVHYQPFVSLKTGDIVGFEALVRWQHPDRGLLMPSTFLGLAEETGLILPIDWWVLRQACYELREWNEDGLAPHQLTVSMNLMSKHMTQPNLVKTIDGILKETHMDPTLLRLEITESVLMENPDAARSLLLQLRERGIKIYIDDFGTGYSSLSYLHRFPIDMIKIDRSFVQGIGGEEKHVEIIRTILALAQALKMNVIAEGIEGVAQLEWLRRFGCEYGQGYYFSQPRNSQEIQELVRGWYAEGGASDHEGANTPDARSEDTELRGALS